MVRKDRHIAGFNDVANSKQNVKPNDDINVNINNNNDINDNDNIDNNDNKNNIDSLDAIINTNMKKEKTHVLKGIYFEKDVALAIDKIARNGGKGIKSQIVNEAVKKVFKEKGWMD